MRFLKAGLAIVIAAFAVCSARAAEPPLAADASALVIAIQEAIDGTPEAPRMVYKILRVLTDAPIDIREKIRQSFSPEPANFRMIPWTPDADLVFILRLKRGISGFEIIGSWAADLKDDPTGHAEGIIEREAKGIEDLKRIEALADDSERSRAFVEVARTSKTPSLCLWIEAQQIFSRGFKDDDIKLRLADGVSLLATRKDAPRYVRTHALSFMRYFSVRNGQNDDALQVLLATRMFDAFQGWAADAVDDREYPEELLWQLYISMQWSSVRAAPSLADSREKLPAEVDAYVRGLERVGDKNRSQRVSGIAAQLLRRMRAEPVPPSAKALITQAAVSPTTRPSEPVSGATATAPSPVTSLIAPPNRPTAGLAILKAVSVASKEDDWVLRYRIVAVIEQPREGKAIDSKMFVDHIVSKINDGWDSRPPSLTPELAFLAKVLWKEGSLQVDSAIGIPVSDKVADPLQAAEFESQGLRDVLKIRSFKTNAGQVVEFIALAASTRTPSGALVMEVEEMARDKTFTDDQLVLLSQGLVQLIARPDVPAYVGHHALRAMGVVTAHIRGIPKEHEHDVIVAAALLQAFHEWVTDPKRDLDFPEMMLDTMNSRLDRAWVRSAPILQADFARFGEDIAIYKQRLEEAQDRVRLDRTKFLESRLLKSLLENRGNNQ